MSAGDSSNAAPSTDAGAATEREMMKKYDLTHTIAKYLDRHMVFPLLDFLQQSEVFKVRDIIKSRFDLLQETSMVDYAIEVFKMLNPDDEVPESFSVKREEVVKEFSKQQTANERIVQLLTSEEVQADIQSMQADGAALRQYLEEKHDFQPEHLESYYEYAQFLYDIGMYENAGIVLYQYYSLSTDPKRAFSALWGKFAASILDQSWDSALEDLKRLQDLIDNKNPASALEQLQQRTWLIHWSLFVFFNHPDGRDGIIDMFLYQPAYANTIQTVCPHILRYLTTAVITNKKRRNVLKDLVRVIQQESYTYRDPITEFLECLYVNFDFDGAQQKLRECETVLENDFFLVHSREEFIDSARLFVFETYCRIHNTISISMLAEKLNMDEEKAEAWIVNLIREAHLDAKIDSKVGHVLMTPQVPSIYHQVIEKTKGLSFRSSAIAENVEKNRSTTGVDFGDKS
eukprot:m.164917 g.164917  ORF g.164917 m.164917 type:complete len:459 (-) comp18117_c1_seq1:244-1620(-)